jgi:hypothetical protein
MTLESCGLAQRWFVPTHNPTHLLALSDSTAHLSGGTREGYGPSIVPTKFGERVFSVNEENIRGYSPFVDFLADWFATSDVRYLEKIATAYYVTTKNPRVPAAERAKS